MERRASAARSGDPELVFLRRRWGRKDECGLSVRGVLLQGFFVGIYNAVRHVRPLHQDRGWNGDFRVGPEYGEIDVEAADVHARMQSGLRDGRGRSRGRLAFGRVELRAASGIHLRLGPGHLPGRVDRAARVAIEARVRRREEIRRLDALDWADGKLDLAGPLISPGRSLTHDVNPSEGGKVSARVRDHHGLLIHHAGRGGGRIAVLPSPRSPPTCCCGSSPSGPSGAGSRACNGHSSWPIP